MKLDKLTKELVSGLKDAGFDQTPKEIQSLSIPKIKSGSDMYIIAPEGSGKSTAIVIGIIQRLKHAFEEAPRALVMVSSQAKAIEMEKEFDRLGKHTNLRTFIVFDHGKLQYQKDMIYEGLDVLIGTPNRIIGLMRIMGIPMIKLLTFAVDDAEAYTPNNYAKHIFRVAENIEKAQFLIVANKWNPNFDRITEEIMKSPIVIECKPTED